MPIEDDDDLLHELQEPSEAERNVLTGSGVELPPMRSRQYLRGWQGGSRFGSVGLASLPLLLLELPIMLALLILLTSLNVYGSAPSSAYTVLWLFALVAGVTVVCAIVKPLRPLGCGLLVAQLLLLVAWLVLLAEFADHAD